LCAAAAHGAAVWATCVGRERGALVLLSPHVDRRILRPQLSPRACARWLTRVCALSPSVCRPPSGPLPIRLTPLNGGDAHGGELVRSQQLTNVIHLYVQRAVSGGRWRAALGRCARSTHRSKYR
jgi:hypothetical protein